MKKLVLITCLAVSLPVSAQCTDCWNGADKKMHFGVSFVLGVATASQWPENKPLAIGAAMIPGVLKEVADAQKGGSGFSGKDIVFDFLGAVSGVYTTSWLISRSAGTMKVSYAAKF